MSSQDSTTKAAARNDEQKAQVRRKIMDAARAIALQDGFAHLSVRKLATAVGYAPGTIYLYFRNRDEIIREICLDGFRLLYAELQRAADSVPPTQRLGTLMRAYARFAFSHPETYRLSFMEDPQFTEELFRAAPLEEDGGAGWRAYGLVVDEVRALKQQGVLRATDDDALIADVLWAGMHGIVSFKLIYPAFPASPTEALIDTMLDALLKGLSA